MQGYGKYRAAPPIDGYPADVLAEQTCTGEVFLKQRNVGRYILTVILIAEALVSIAFDWNKTHLFNPTWPPHAIFHMFVEMNDLVATSLIALWLLWRKSTEPRIALRVAVLVPLSFWSAFFYGTVVLSNATLKASPDEHWPEVGGFMIHPNVVTGFVWIILALIGYRIGMQEIKSSQNSVG